MRNTYSIYLVFGRKFRIPVNPEEISITRPTDHQTYHIIDKGEIVIPRKPALKTVAWESFFPGDSYAGYANPDAREPEYYVKALERAWKDKEKGRLIISRSEMYDTNMRCIISNFKTVDKGGEPTDVYYSLELTEYRNYSPRVISVVIQPETSEEPVQAMPETQREVEKPVLRVGAPVVANGKYWYSSYGDKPYGTANNLNTTVTRIVSGNPYPIHIGHYGWLQESQIQIVG